ncbi:MAG TPA: hypothetical protein VFC71_06440 [Candidatus Polarisedimenticolia bacterium]|nr:hypothetical protein [Candidatus Polarisedimenticolia bacterium]
MNGQEAIDFLGRHQPMPPDEELTDELIGQFDEARRALALDPQGGGVRLLLNAIGRGSGFGVYQLVDDTLRAYDPDNVVQVLAELLATVPDDRSGWLMEYALDYPDERLIDPVVEALVRGDRDTRFFAASFLVDQFRDVPRVREAVRSARAREDDPEIVRVLDEAHQ